MKNILYTIILSFLFSSSVFGEWTLITSSKVSDIYIDLSSVQKSTDFTDYWSLINFKTKTQLKGYLSSIMLSEISCIMPIKFRALQTTAYSAPFGQGEASNTDRNITDWHYPRPSGVQEALHKKICGL